jgi:hypothetical protein
MVRAFRPRARTCGVCEAAFAGSSRMSCRILSCLVRFHPGPGALAGGVVLCMAHAAAGANLFVNGALDGPVNTYSLVPPGWANYPTSGTTDTMSAAGHPFGPAFAGIGEFPYANSSNGGTFAWSADYSMAGTDPEGLRQTVGGLSIGQQYRISFEYTNLGLYNDTGSIVLNAFNVGQRYDTAGRWQVLINNGLLQATPAVDFTQTFGQQVWRTYSVRFTATAASVQFDFVSDWVSGSGDHVGMGIDAISLDAVPGPGGIALLGLGGMVATRRRR